MPLRIGRRGAQDAACCAPRANDARASGNFQLNAMHPATPPPRRRGTAPASISANQPATQEIDMLAWTLTFLIIAIIAAALGFTGVAGAAASIAQFIFVVFLVLFVLSLIFGWVRRPRV
jgi:uncharacterized membrane protein YtjA (UPF0391 family)